MKRIFTLMLGALALGAVALISAFVAMRLAIHGREVEVPAMSGLTMADATRLASHSGLNLTLENRFYSADVPAGRVLAQSPAPGSRVRRDWAVRVTESLGAQRVSIPELTGESERAATIAIRRLSLEPGVVAHLPIAGDPDVVVAQTPTANAGSVAGPRVSLLVSAPDDTGPGTAAYVMPTLVGLSYAAASARAAAMGVRIAVATPDVQSDDGSGSGAGPQSGSAPAPPPAGLSSPDGAIAPAFATPSGLVLSQSPLPGRRIARGGVVHVTLGHPSGATASSAATVPGNL